VPDVYTTIAAQDDAVVEQLAAAMELRARDPRQRAFVDEYLSGVDLPPGARVVEIGCGTGAISRVLAARDGVAELVGVDPSPVLVARARELAGGVAGLRFEVADGAATPLDDDGADLVVLHTVLSHAPDPEGLVAEAARLLRPGGALALFDGDYATMTLALGEQDPLQACATAFAGSYINDRWVVRRAAAMAVAAGFTDVRTRSHGYVQIDEPDYLLSIADRGADVLATAGTIGPDLAAALKSEARRRAAAGRFFGFIAYLSVVARWP
jgi:SAM-dependent methyltransferase